MSRNFVLVKPIVLDYHLHRLVAQSRRPYPEKCQSEHKLTPKEN